MIFIKPTVVRGPAGAVEVTQDRYDYLIGEQNKLNPPPRIFWNDPTYPQLSPSGTLPGGAPLVAPMAPSTAARGAAMPARPLPRRLRHPARTARPRRRRRRRSAHPRRRSE